MQVKELKFSSGQLQQIIIGVISIIIFFFLQPYLLSDELSSDTMLGISSLMWYWLVILIPIFHQIIIAPLWRTELLSNGMTNFFGSTNRAFNIFKILFALFFIPRLFIAIPLAVLTQLTLPSMLTIVSYIVAIILTPIILYGLYSIRHYFGINRAFGADHFFEEYREMSKVQDGLFKYTDNAMYTFILSITWVPSLFFLSFPAVVTGLFSHLFVWVHYFFIEKPDMEYIYG